MANDWKIISSSVGSPFSVRFVYPGVVATGSDVAVNHYALDIPSGSKFIIEDWQLTNKVKGAATVDVLKSTDAGATWVSIFASSPPTYPTITSSDKTKDGTSFVTNYAERADLVRVDILAADGTAAGLELVLRGKVSG